MTIRYQSSGIGMKQKILLPVSVILLNLMMFPRNVSGDQHNFNRGCHVWFLMLSLSAQERNLAATVTGPLQLTVTWNRPVGLTFLGFSSMFYFILTQFLRIFFEQVQIARKFSGYPIRYGTRCLFMSMNRIH